MMLTHPRAWWCDTV